MQMGWLVAIGAVVLVACSSRSTAPAPHGQPSASGDAAAPAVVDATSGWKTFHPRDGKRDPPPDGVLRLTLMQSLIPIPLIPQRTSDTDGIVALTFATERALVAYDAAHAGRLGQEVHVWLAMKPGRRVRAWITTDRELSLRDEQALTVPLAELQGPVVHDGLFAVILSFHRAEIDVPDGASIPPIPEIWAAFMHSDAEPVDVLIERVWPD